MLSAIFVTDPALIFERGLVTIERSFSLVQRGVDLLARLNFDGHDSGELTRENVYALCFGLMFFSLATSMFVTPLPIFFAAKFGSSHKHSICAVPSQLFRLPHRVCSDEEEP